MKMIFFKFIIIFMFKDQNLAEYWTNLAENLKKIGSRGVRGVCFFNCLGSHVVNVPRSMCHGQQAVAVSRICLVRTPNHLIMLRTLQMSAVVILLGFWGLIGNGNSSMAFQTVAYYLFLVIIVYHTMGIHPPHQH